MSALAALRELPALPMNIAASEFVAVLEDAMAALEKNNIGQREQEEVLFILFGLRSQVILV